MCGLGRGATAEPPVIDHCKFVSWSGLQPRLFVDAGMGSAEGAPLMRPAAAGVVGESEEAAGRPQRSWRRVAAGCAAVAVAAVVLTTGTGGRIERLAVLPDQPYGVPACGAAVATLGAPCPKLRATQLQAILANVKTLRSRIRGFSKQTAGYSEDEGKAVAGAMRQELRVEEALGRTAVDKDKFVKFITSPGPVGRRGAQGLPGPQGSNGRMGPAGLPGDPGDRGDIGAPGPAGGFGTPGKAGKAGDVSGRTCAHARSFERAPSPALGRR